MRTKKSKVKSTALLAGILVGGTALNLSAANVNSSDLLDYTSLGSGAELRTELLDLNRISLNAIDRINSENTLKFSELKCGEGKCGGDKENEKEGKVEKGEKAKESKTDESKCGEGKCGGEESESKKEDK
ncbi:hypothetical protein ES705_29299 [subsurface metagenome]